MKIANEIDSVYIDEIVGEFPQLSNHNVSIYTDGTVGKLEAKILAILKKNKKRFRTTLYYILSTERSRNHYSKCTGFNNIYEIILTKGKRSNIRIYCKEFFDEGRKVIMLLALEKDFNSIKDNKKLFERLLKEDHLISYRYIKNEKKGSN